MNINDIKNKSALGEYECKIPFPHKIKKMKEGTVIDEEKSVRWNKEEVVRLNVEADKTNKISMKEHNDENSRVYDLLNCDIVKATKEEYPKLNIEQIQKIINFINEEHGDGIMNCIDELCSHCELYLDLLKMQKGE